MKFGTSGLRGLVCDLEGRASALYTAAFARFLLDEGLLRPTDPVLVGHDLRPSSPGIAATCIGALERAGLVPLSCGAIPTPALALYGLHLGAASLMVTGSHIPADRNGIKFFTPNGEITKADEERIAALAEELGRGVLDHGPAAAADHSHLAMTGFLERCRIMLPPAAFGGLKVGVYQHSTVARDLLVAVLEEYGAQVIALGRSNHFIPVDTEALSPEITEHMRHWAREHELDAVVSADGDGDRPLVADERGDALRGDLLGLMTANFLGARLIVTPVTSNSGIEGAGAFQVIRTRVGSPFVIAEMERAIRAGAEAVLGFEANGGTLTGSPFPVAGGMLSPLPTRDSLLPILSVLQAVAKEKRPLSRIAGDYGLPHALSDRLEDVPVAISTRLMAHLRESESNLSAFLAPVGRIASTSDIDGLRITLADGRILHLRPSGNAPEMRCYAEARTPEACASLLRQGLSLIREWTERHQM